MVACLVTGLLGVSAVAAQELLLVQIGPLSGAATADARELNEGLQAHLDQVNRRGGVRGYTLRLTTLDDRRDADVFVTRFREAIAMKPLALMSPIGSTLIKRMLDDKLLDSADVVVINAIPGAEVLRNPGHPKLFHLRSGDRVQIERIVAHAATLGIRRFAVLHQDAPVGKSGRAVAEAAAAQLGGKLKLSSTESSPETGPLTEAAATVARSTAQSVLVLGSPMFVQSGIKALRASGSGQSLYALSDVSAAGLVRVAGEHAARGVAIAQNYPNPEVTRSALQRDFQSAMRQSKPNIRAPYTALQLEGFLTARVLTTALARARTITPDGLAQALRSEPIDLGGLRIDFTQGNAGSRFVDIGVVTERGRLMY